MPTIEQFVKSLQPQIGLGWVLKVKGKGPTEFVHRSFIHDRVVSGMIGEVRIDFLWEFDTTPELNAGVVKLYNLDNARMAEFEKGGPLTLKASWQAMNEENRLVVQGTVDAIEDYAEGEKRAFKIFFSDAPENVYGKISARTWKPNVSYSRVFLDLAKDTELKIKIFSPAHDGLYRTGMNVFGSTWQAMCMTARDMRSKLYVYNREICLLKPDGHIGPEVTWSQITGLQKLQRAVMLTQDAQAKVKFAKYEPVAYRIKNLFTPELGPDAVVNIINVQPSFKNFMALGKYRVVRGIHYCDGREYITEVDVVPIDLAQQAKREAEAVAGQREGFRANWPVEVTR